MSVHKLVAAAKGVGIVTATLLSVAATLVLFQSVLGWAWRWQARPMLEALDQQAKALGAEQRARVVADSLLAIRMSDLSRDRIDLLNILETAPGSPERRDAVLKVRAIWEYRDGRR